MPTKQTPRPAPFGIPVSSTTQSTVRILIASYFLAIATGLVSDPVSHNFLPHVMDAETATLLTTLYLFPTAFLVMVGYAVRPAALLLAVYLFWASFVHFYHAPAAGALAVFWQNVALLAGLTLVAITKPGGSRGMRLRHRTVTPRRVQLKTQPRRARPVKTPQIVLASKAEWLAANSTPMPFKSRRASGENAEPVRENIFRDDFDTALSA